MSSKRSSQDVSGKSWKGEVWRRVNNEIKLDRKKKATSLQNSRSKTQFYSSMPADRIASFPAPQRPGVCQHPLPVGVGSRRSGEGALPGTASSIQELVLGAALKLLTHRG